MGAVDTTYTFTATDTITSTKMNNIIDQTTITTDAIIGTTLDVASGKLKVRSQGITSNEMGSASVTQTAFAPNVAGNGPAFRAYASTSTTIPRVTFTKINFNSEDFDTNSNFASSRFTPSVAGYYLITGCFATSSAIGLMASIRKNTSDYSFGTGQSSATSLRAMVSDIVFLNGSTDYVELTAYHESAGSISIEVNSNQTYFSGCLIRSA